MRPEQYLGLPAMTLETKIAETLNSHINAGDLPGAAWWVSSRDEVARGAAGTFGPQDPRPITADTVFRVSSMTKPVVAAGAMTLIDDGTLELDASIDELLPELANRQVLIDAAGPLTETVPAHRPITVRDLLEFRLGLGMDFTGPWPGAVLSALAEAGLAVGPPAPQQNPVPDEWLRLLGTVPLAYQPGERWLYHTGASVLGVLIARATGRSLPAVLDERILTPLGMRSTGFGVSAGTRDRFGPHWVPGPDGAPPELYDAADGQWSQPPAFPDGGDGLVSTVDDFAAFAGMLSAGGVATDGRRVLSAAAVTAMTTDQIGPVDEEGGGWGLGMGVRRIDEPGRRHAGSYGWDGGMGSSWWTDPVSGVTAVLLTNQMWNGPQPPTVVTEFWSAAFGGR
jgi:CubicO group peptidase (beta-lactamase class C family)